MANQRISAMPSGAPAQAADAVLINRSGTNYKVTAASIGGTFTNLPSWQAVQASNFTAVSGYGYFVNTTSAAVTMTLPATPTAGDVIAVVDYAGTFGTNRLNIDPNGNNFNGAASVFIANTNRAGFQIVYVDATQGWECFADKSESLIVQGAFTPPSIGAAFAGGYYAGQVSTAGTGVADYYLVVAPKSTGQSGSQNYQNTPNTLISDASSPVDGRTNSLSASLVPPPSNCPSAVFCESLTIGGYTDWYLPSRYEFEICYYNLKPTTGSNDTSTGTNPYSVPPRASNYTAGNPAQTTVTDFQSGGTQSIEAAFPSYFWTSTQNSINSAWLKGSGSGDEAAQQKAIGAKNRAIRRLPV